MSTNTPALQSRAALVGSVDTRPNWGYAALRLVVGVTFFAKGVLYIVDTHVLVNMVHASAIPWKPAILAHAIALTHLGGGLLLSLGFLTRWAALAQIPILAGAIGWIHLGAGLLGPTESLSFALVMLAATVVFAISGAGRLSVDRWLERATDG